MSLPDASVVVPEASAAPAPPLDPPTPNSGFHGLRVIPWIRECVKNAHEYSGAVVRAWTIAPASSIRRVKTEEWSATRSL
jgi:hypothetical protein